MHVRDPSAEQRTQCLKYAADNISTFEKLTASTTTGKIDMFEELEAAVTSAWLIIEAIPEILTLKKSTFVALEESAPKDSILATNSSSYKSSELISEVLESTKRRVLNTHYYMPPDNMVVELMTDQSTEQGIFPFLVERLKETGVHPYVARKESTGFIFNRLWAAVKRETLMILSEGVSDAKEIDSLWEEMFIKGKALPCKTMDAVGLDTVALIEGHYITERGLPSTHMDYLKANYLDHGKLGNKSGAGGLYPPHSEFGDANEANPTILVLDSGLAQTTPGANTGEILEIKVNSKQCKVRIGNQSLPDGIAVDSELQRMFWTNMGTPGKLDGAVFSAKLDGSDVQTLVPKGKINTPKQLCLDSASKKVYFSDREGCAVYRVDYDGSELELLIKTGNSVSDPTGAASIADWCVGVAISRVHERLYWTEKGQSKGSQGRIFSACLSIPEGYTAKSREDIALILSNLPEPIDLELDEDNTHLYWTDRGELPWGNSLNRVDLDNTGLSVLVNKASSANSFVIARHFNEAIGLKLDQKHSKIYVADLGGSIYSCNLDGSKKQTVYSDETRAFTGIALV